MFGQKSQLVLHFVSIKIYRELNNSVQFGLLFVRDKSAASNCVEWKQRFVTVTRSGRVTFDQLITAGIIVPRVRAPLRFITSTLPSDFFFFYIFPDIRSFEYLV